MQILSASMAMILVWIGSWHESPSFGAIPGPIDPELNVFEGILSSTEVLDGKHSILTPRMGTVH
jgi:hypothetical protein